VGAYLVAAVAETPGLVLLCHDDAFELIADVTGQSAERIGAEQLGRAAFGRSGALARAFDETVAFEEVAEVPRCAGCWIHFRPRSR